MSVNCPLPYGLDRGPCFTRSYQARVLYVNYLYEWQLSSTRWPGQRTVLYSQLSGKSSMRYLSFCVFTILYRLARAENPAALAAISKNSKC